MPVGEVALLYLLANTLLHLLKSVSSFLPPYNNSYYFLLVYLFPYST